MQSYINMYMYMYLMLKSVYIIICGHHSSTYHFRCSQIQEQQINIRNMVLQYRSHKWTTNASCQNFMLAKVGTKDFATCYKSVPIFFFLKARNKILACCLLELIPWQFATCLNQFVIDPTCMILACYFHFANC